MGNTGNPQGMPNMNQPFTGANAIITRPWFIFLQSVWNRTGAALGGTVVPTGVVMDFAGPGQNIPAGWIVCGQAVSRADFANLFSVIGTTWGPGDGSGTFDLPPQNVFSKGVGSDTVGSRGGASTATITTAQLPAHSHTIDDPGHTHLIDDPGHTHAITDPQHHHSSVIAGSTVTVGVGVGGISPSTGNTGDAPTGITINTSSTGVTNETAQTGVTTEDTGGGTPLSILPPYATFFKIIKT